MVVNDRRSLGTNLILVNVAISAGQYWCQQRPLSQAITLHFPDCCHCDPDSVISPNKHNCQDKDALFLN